ncbi:hypothetical protein [Paeniglutamicibacter cryotolerans]|uniref:hypothetical protein n=1 Tax=Paeniglutamicibacter cryotolerans TaxID=670079 RepID=UPI00161427F9|nr:hypothetical protein [Paeniglutamicibacter cryotolerans]
MANWVNLSTPLGLALARATGCRLEPGRHYLHYALEYGKALPNARAFTVGSVLFFRPPISDPPLHLRLLEHEESHAGQYAWCLGLPFLPLYFATAGASLLLCGDPAALNPFERRAGLEAGGYGPRSPGGLLARLAKPTASRTRKDTP